MEHQIMSDYQQPSTSTYNTKDQHQYDDDSFESCTSYSDEFLQFSPTIKLHPRLSSTFKHNLPLDNDKSCGPTEYKRENTTDFINQSDSLNNLTVWERWLVTKLQVEREKSKIKKMQAKIEKKEKERIEKEKEEKKIQAHEKQQEWLNAKITKIKLQNANEKRQQQIKKEIELEKAAQLKADAELNFKKWMDKQQEIDRQKRLKEKKEKEEELKLKEEKKKVAEENFKRWLRENKDRIAALNLKEPPVPSYVNPNPWIEPDQDASRRRPKETIRPRSCREQHRQFSFSAKRCSTPKPRSRGLNTHTPLRTGRAPQNSSACPPGLLRVHTPLRFSGYRPKSDRVLKTNDSNRPKSAPSKHAPAPRPLTGIPKSSKQKR